MMQPDIRLAARACSTGRVEIVKGAMMKPLICVATVVTIAAITIAAPFSAFAQSNAPMTRGEAKAQLAQLENAGYNPSANDPSYPRNVQAAIVRVDNSEGGVSEGTNAVGTHLNAAVPVAPMSGPNSAYFGQ